MVRKDDAVSPVVGVMLMLVVTIIIAASVTLFSTGFIGDLSQSLDSLSTDTKVNFVGVDDGGAKAYADAYISDHGGSKPNFKTEKISGNIGFVFEVESGDPLDLTKLAFQISSTSGGTTTITYNDLPSQMYYSDHSGYGNNQVILPAPGFFGNYASRMVAYPVGAESTFLTKTLINPGEKFLIVTEYVYYTHNAIGIRADRLDANEAANSGNAYNSGAYGLTSATSIKLYNTETGAVIYSGLGSDGVWL